VTDPERAGSFHAINIAKRGITLDLTKPEGQAYARELIAVSDVVIENFAAGQMERFGLGLETVRAIRPDVIMASSSGLGRTGPLRGYVAYGNTIHAYAGLSALVGHPGGPPRGIPNTYTDPLTGATQCLAILAALRLRERTGQGCTIDLSMAEATMALLPEAFMDYAMNGRVASPQGNLDPQLAPHNVYPCKGEDRWVAIAVDSDAAWQRFCAAIGRPDWGAESRFANAPGRVQDRDELDRGIEEWTSCYTPEEVTATLQASAVAAGPSYTVADLLADPHLKERGFFIAPEHPLTGARPLPGLPWHFTPPLSPDLRPAPLLGQHNAEVYRDLLGLSAAALARLEAEKAIW
jgi:benzylsuccinate CoA-transferase BbsF subunit